MEKIKEITRKVKDYEHSFYCDECGEYLGKSTECDNGWYERYGEFELEFYVVDSWYRVKKHLCNNCKQNFINNVKIALTNLGFEKF